MVALLLAGTIVLCAGLLAVVFGIPIKEFSFGNTMILAGAAFACTGIVLIGLSFVVRELKNLAHRLDQKDFTGSALAGPGARSAAGIAADAPRGRGGEPGQPKTVRAAPRNSAKPDVLFSRDEPRTDDFADELDRLPPAPSLSPGSAPAWSDESEHRARSVPPPRPPERAGEAGRRDILFSSTRRDQQNGASDFGADADPFESGWPGTERAPRNGHGGANGRSHGARRNEASSVTVVKSGVVDAMAYSLYSDGSIEAQMPEGMVRFESIEDLRAHLDQRN